MTREASANRQARRGVALLTVLLLVAVMSALAVGILDDIRFGLRRTANARDVGQAQWYALGAETLAATRIEALLRAGGERTPPDGWNGRPFVFPTDDGGQITAVLRDGGNCFNLNSVVEGRGDLLLRREAGRAQFIALMVALDIPAATAERLADATADWIDVDGFRQGRGAEDAAYALGATPYRTGGQLLAEVSEMRAIRGMTPELYARLRPWVCALPSSELSPINVNTLQPDRALLLVAISEGRIDERLARRVLAGRPEGGWASLGDFWGQPALAAAEPPDAALEQATLRTRYFALEADVLHAGSTATLSTLLEQTADGRVRSVARRWTRDE